MQKEETRRAMLAFQRLATYTVANGSSVPSRIATP